MINRKGFGWLKALIEEGNGTPSSTRLGFLVWVVGVFVVWAMVSVKCHTDAAGKLILADIPTNVFLLLATLMTGKVIQKQIEGKGPDECVDPAPNPPVIPPAPNPPA